jgi:TRAP-type C4-dicarboxylate transport system permease large subunit
MSLMPNRMQEGMSHPIPAWPALFVFLGSLIEMTARPATINFLVSLIGHVRGGLQYVLLGRCNRLGHLGAALPGHGRSPALFSR